MSTRGSWVTRVLVGALLPVVGAATSAAQTTERLSVDSAGNQSNGDSNSASISGDGWYVAFQSCATNLVPGDTNGTLDVFLRNRCLFCDGFEYGDTAAWSGVTP